MGGWRNIAAVLIILSTLALVGLLAVSGHSQHLYAAVGYALMAAYLLTRIVPREAESEKPFDPDAGFRFDAHIRQEPSGCQCCTDDVDKEMK